MKNISKIVIVLSVLLGTLFISLASYSQVPPQWSCTAANARGYTFVGNAYGMGHAQRNALAYCANSGATSYAGNCHIVGCQRVGYAPPPPPPAPVPAPVYGHQFLCTAWGWHHSVAGTATSFNLNKAAYKAVRNCARNGGVNCRVYSSSSCPV